MIESGSQRVGSAFYTRSPLFAFSLFSIVLATALVWASELVLTSPFWVLGMFSICVLLVARGLLTSYPHEDFGLCNTVTLIRAALMAFVFGAIFEAQSVSPWLVFWVGTAGFALDAVDGWLARRSGLHSKFGARFDMEIDAALGAVLTLWLLASGTTGPEILVLGFMRYAFVAAGWWFPALRAELPDSFRRKAICVVQIGALILLVLPLAPAALIFPVVLMASTALIYSFAVDIAWLVRCGK